VTLAVVWLEAATTEYYEALEWYAEVSPQLSQRFAQAIEGTVQTIAEFPLRFPVVHKGRRRAGVRRFPYGLFYLVEDSRLLVIACFHGRRDPRRWQRR
jgi:toxin ParE1/3/4